MRLTFQGYGGNERFISNVADEEECMDKIKEFCDERNFHIYYTRVWENKEGAIIFDVGSHCEFFKLYKED